MLHRYTVEFSVPFLQGKQRPRFGGGHVRTPKETRDAEDAIAMAYKGASIRAYGKVAFAPQYVPVHVRVEFYKAEPKRFPRYLPRWLRPLVPFVVKIDIDNGAKCVLDGLNGVAWHDDAQVVTMFARKRDRGGVTHDRTDVTVVWEAED